jgi:hypothetical protein
MGKAIAKKPTSGPLDAWFTSPGLNNATRKPAAKRKRIIESDDEDELDLPAAKKPALEPRRDSAIDLPVKKPVTASRSDGDFDQNNWIDQKAPRFTATTKAGGGTKTVSIDPISESLQKLTHVKQPFLYFEQKGHIVMDVVYKSKCSPAWRKELDAKSSSKWFEELLPFVPDPVKTAFNQQNDLPSVAELRTLTFYGGQCGSYGDVLTPRSPSSGLPTFLYPGATTHRPAHERKLGHNQPSRLNENPTSRYYKLKHENNDFSSQFVSFARIPIPGWMDEAETGRRRVLCRLAETFFAVLTRSIDETNLSTNTRNFLQVANTASRKAHTNESLVQTEWKGLATHSPLAEQLGKASYGTVAKGRYNERMGYFAEVYGGMQHVPEDIEQAVAKRSVIDVEDVKQRRDLRTEKERADEVHKQAESEYKKKKRANETAEEREERLSYFPTWRENKQAAMTVEDKDEERAYNARKTRKFKVMRAFRAKVLTKQQVDAAEAKDWFGQPGFPTNWNEPPPKKSSTAA